MNTRMLAMLLLLAGAASLTLPAGAQTAAGQGITTAAADPAGGALRALGDEFWASVMDSAPTFASSLGKPGYDGRVSDYSLAGMDRDAAASARFLTRLDAIAVADLSPADRVNHAILRRMLAETVAANRLPQRVMNFTNRSGWHQDFAGMAGNQPFRTLADYKSHVDRLAQYGRVNDQAMAVADQAIRGGYTLPCSAITGYEGTISGLFIDPAKPDAVKASRFYEPFARPRPATVDAAGWTAEAARAETVIRTIIDPALRRHHAWFTTRYAPACAKADGITSQPGGAEYYQFRIGQMTTTDLPADQIHDIGLKEVARIRAEMVEVATRAGYPTREAFIAHLRTDPRYYAKSPEELMQYVARVTKTIDGKMPSLFHRLPRLPYGIKEIPAEIAEGTTTAYYNQGSPDIGIAGFYFVNTSKLDQRPLWEVPALSVHEAVPGHHHQIALQQELDLPEWRKQGAFFTAFVEGWGLYSERLGIEMGLYDTPARDMGRLSYEMWRACRLVVDTGIHAKGWSKQRAIDFMTDNSALSTANIEAEVNRYIAWPGQALAYKLGELKIRELRSAGEQALGARFDLAAFHDVVLGQGSVPLDVLDTQVRAWIAEQAAQPAKS